jgi:hypothetical protein
MGERRDIYGVFVRKYEGKIQLGNPGFDWRIILKRIFRKWDGGMDWIDLA